GTGNPGSVAAWGDTLYVGSLFGGGTITQVDDPLGNETSLGQLSGSLTIGGNGYTTLNTDGTTLVAATSNTAANDVLQVFDVATATLRYESLASGLPGPNTGRIDGAAIDPITGNIFVSAFNAAIPSVFNANTLTDESDGTTDLSGPPPVSTGFRDLTFDRLTGDIYTRLTNGITAGERLGANIDDFTKIESLGATAGATPIAGADSVTLQDSFQPALNIEFLPATFTGTQDIVITNTRVSGSSVFADQVLAFDADAGFDGSNPFSINTGGVAEAINFFETDGVTPFTTSGSGNAIYDFSFDPINEVLYVADEDNGSIYVFSEPFVPPSLDGDYSDNGVVDAADYTVWRDNVGTLNTLPNDVTPGVVDGGGLGDGGDYDVWVNAFGNTASAASVVPEPTAIVVAIVGIAASAARRRV
ncbi:MAG: hypothetical protein AAF805_04220, partial [Planctomycetota bacterium]